MNDINNHVYNHQWIVVVKSILDDAGYTYIWISQCEGITSASVFKQYINARLTDQYLQSWYTYIDNSSKASNYKLSKHTFTFETSITMFEKKYWCPFIRFRLSNHNLPIETWQVGKCNNKKQNMSIGDEFHYICEQTHISIKWKEETNQDLVAKRS